MAVVVRVVSPQLVKRFGAIIMMVNIAVAFFSVTDMYLLASGAIQVDPPDEDSFETGYDPVSMDIVFMSRYTVVNNGFYDVDDLDIISTLTTERGEVLIDYGSLDHKVPRWTTRTFPIEARLPLERFLELDLGHLLFNDTSFTLDVGVGAKYVMGLVKFDLDQSREYPWEPPLADYRDILGDGTLEAAVNDLLGMDIGGASDKVATGVYGAFLGPGKEARVPLNGYSDLVFTVEGDTLHIRVEIVEPFQMTVLDLELPLDQFGVDGDVEGSGGGPVEG